MEKIDIVYTWVDGSEPEWISKRDFWAKKEGFEINSANGRYMNNDELKYSLRSIDQYAPWINNVYIITDNQLPNWLNTNNDKIKIVKHEDIIPSKYLPTFNSYVIEFCICNIPDLAEKFLYANDDMFMLKRLKPDFFFSSNGKPIFRFFDKYELCDDYEKQLLNADTLVLQKYGKSIGLYPHHNIDAYIKSDISNCCKEFSDSIEKTLNSRFRTSENISRALYAYYAILINHGVQKKLINPIKIHSYNKYIPFSSKIIRYINSRIAEESVYIGADKDNYSSFLKNKTTKLFCLNDNELTSDVNRVLIKDFLEQMFPAKSSFEK